MKRLIALCGGTLMVLALSASAAQAQDRTAERGGAMPAEARLGPRGQLRYPDMPWYYQVNHLEFHYGARIDRVHCALRGDWECHTRLGGLTWDVNGDGRIDQEDHEY
ncbi:MAG: hypothetical protein ACK47B_20205 [Armatimonadota bacterium]